MKNIFIISVFSLFALCAVSCSDKDGDRITLPNEEQRVQTLDADAVSAKITFIAPDDWSAVINRNATRSTGPGSQDSGTGTANPYWIFLDTYEGTAGTVNLPIWLDANYTGRERKAAITIKSGSDSVVITVTQSATDSDGNIPTDPGEPGPVEPADDL